MDERSLNTANTITIIRLLLIPVFIGLLLFYNPDAGEEWMRIAAFVVFVVAAASDGIDGYVARHYNQKTRLGAALDPLADKLLINVSFIFLAVLTSLDTDVPRWLPVVVLGRDVTISTGSFILNKHLGPLKPRPRLLGKLATWAHSIAIGAVVINFPYAEDILMVVVSISVLSLMDYLLHGYEESVSADHTQPGAV